MGWDKQRKGKKAVAKLPLTALCQISPRPLLQSGRWGGGRGNLGLHGQATSHSRLTNAFWGPISFGALACARTQRFGGVLLYALVGVFTVLGPCTSPAPHKFSYPAPPLAISHPLQSPPPPGDRHFHVFLVDIYCAGLCCSSALAWPCIAFPLLQINHLCVFCDVLSPKALYGCVVLLYQTQDVFFR